MIEERVGEEGAKGAVCPLDGNRLSRQSRRVLAKLAYPPVFSDRLHSPGRSGHETGRWRRLYAYRLLVGISEADGERLAEVAENSLAQRRSLLTELPALPGDRARPCALSGSPAPFSSTTGFMGWRQSRWRCRSEEELRPVMEQLQWGMPLLELFFRRQQDAGRRGSHVPAALGYRPSGRRALPGKIRWRVHDLRNGRRRPSCVRQGQPRLSEEA